ncbi:hypothetical protein CWI66_12615 [Halomonas sp. 141]|uniref:hypothetical protein n=1 Tax=Halomonas sp. 141 TaxID=2056666 RepID=UPI000CB3A7C8|nr:hypothetical protein [Halomonas sp. 141]PJX13397.1 hypothetical protein CWI66_12615 [Halomonas sp. 141]
MNTYLVHFKVTRENGQLAEHTHAIERDEAIEYVSDIQDIQAELATSLGVTSTMVVSWRLLKGMKRPH